jgi:hypothetical protein
MKSILAVVPDFSVSDDLDDATNHPGALTAGLAFRWLRRSRYRDMRGTIVSEAVATLATPEYFFRLPLASLTRTR